ncbi:Proline-rich receptor protein kinase PERK1 [Spatholobus suberectus]|nr:Proline-rich receptor protein kinase PERK1 [Spatholobus suberectus]
MFPLLGRFNYEELARATDEFSDANLLGEGGFGHVHRGVLPNGKEVAIKQLKAGSGQGDREFQAEVDIISRIHHKHLVSLVGYCITGIHRLLVYDFVPNKTLQFHLHGEGKPDMDWPTRLRIALGAAKGLAYLHEDCQHKIIHRDIKAANVLLDFNFEAKVADFGLAKLCSDNNSHVPTRVMGTLGYLAPEYASSGKLTEKSDVYSFGVMLLELITGCRPHVSNDPSIEDSLVDWARPLLTPSLKDKNFDILADPRLHNEYDPNEMTCMVACAASSIKYSPKDRPRMSQVVRILEGDVSVEDLNDKIHRLKNIPDHNYLQYKEYLNRREVAKGNQDYGSSNEYSGSTMVVVMTTMMVVAVVKPTVTVMTVSTTVVVAVPMVIVVVPMVMVVAKSVVVVTLLVVVVAALVVVILVVVVAVTMVVVMKLVVVEVMLVVVIVVAAVMGGSCGSGDGGGDADGRGSCGSGDGGGGAGGRGCGGGGGDGDGGCGDGGSNDGGGGAGGRCGGGAGGDGDGGCRDGGSDDSGGGVDGCGGGVAVVVVVTMTVAVEMAVAIVVVVIVVVTMAVVVVVVVARKTIVKYNDVYLFLKTKNQIHKSFFLGFENECKSVLKLS